MYEIAAASFKKYYTNLLRNSSEQAFVIPSIIGCAQKGNILSVIGICQRYIDVRDTSFYNSFTCLRRKAKREFLTCIIAAFLYLTMFLTRGTNNTDAQIASLNRWKRCLLRSSSFPPSTMFRLLCCKASILLSEDPFR